MGDLRRAMQHSCQTTTTTTNLTAGGISHLQLEARFFLKKPSAHTPGCPGGRGCDPVRRKCTSSHSRQKDVTAYADTSPSSALSTFSSVSQKHQLNTTTIVANSAMTDSFAV